MKLFFYLFFSLTTITLFGQTPDKDRYELGMTTGYAYSKGHFLQLGAIWGKDYGNVHVPSKGFGVGTDLGLVNDKLTIGAKGFIEYNAYIITAFRLNAINYFRQGQSDFRIIPEVGLTMFGQINFMYGYGIPISKNEITDIGRHRFALTFNLFRKKE
jgi:hypothetical protein